MLLFDALQFVPILAAYLMMGLSGKFAARRGRKGWGIGYIIRFTVRCYRRAGSNPGRTGIEFGLSKDRCIR